MPEDKLQALAKEVYASTPIWCPNPGPQIKAADCQADELFYGGQAGGGKTDLLVGLSLTKHKRSLILRRTNKEAGKLVERFEEIIGNRDGWNSQKSIWRFPDGKIIDIGGCQHEDDKQSYKGTPHDLICFDEVSDFTETQFRFIKGWNRSANKDQRCRVVCAGNPPTTPEGLWVLQYWAPWLDPAYPNPAQPGELRWFTTVEGKDAEVDGPGPHNIGGRMLRARSRTFIPAALSDNPDLAATDYESVLAALPEELRVAYMEGRFDAGLRDDEWQVIPTAWIMEAQKRWTPEPPNNAPMTAMALDVAQGGADNTVLACRHDYWYAPLISRQGAETPTPSSAAALVVQHRRNNAGVVIDMGGGYGGGVKERLNENDIEVVGFNGANAGVGRTKDNMLSFVNDRALSMWRFREALDPDQPGGSPVMLPPGATIRADLAAPRWKLVGRGIQVESKGDIKKRIGRSPDEGDAVWMAYEPGNRAIRRAMHSKGFNSYGGQRQTRAAVGYTNMKRRRR